MKRGIRGATAKSEQRRTAETTSSSGATKSVQLRTLAGAEPHGIRARTRSGGERLRSFEEPCGG